MEMRKIGNSGLIVSELCLGTMIFGEDSPRSTPPEVGMKIIDQFLDSGGNFIDTANVYADGRSEEIVGKSLCSSSISLPSSRQRAKRRQ